MPRHAKGPRLYLRRGRIDQRSGKALPDVYFIRDGSTEISTGCGPDRMPEAEGRLATYILGKTAPVEADGDPAAVKRRKSDPARVFLAEILAEYAETEAKTVADPEDEASFIATLLTWWGDRYADGVKTSTCKSYVDKRKQDPDRRYKNPEAAPRVSAQTARRELEVLSAAIGYWDREHHLSRRPAVWLPEKPESQRDALTRSQAAALLWAAMGHRRRPDGSWQKLEAQTKAKRRHLRRYLIIGLYTGTRPGVLTKLLREESAAQAWVDPVDGIIYRRGRAERDHATKKRPLVKIPRRLLAHMRRWFAADERAMAAAADLAKDQGRAPPDPLTTVLHYGGRPIAGKIRTGFEGIVRDAGLNSEITPHWMRHTCATWLMERGCDVWDAAGYTGMSTAMLESRYGHHRPDHQSGARKALGG